MEDGFATKVAILNRPKKLNAVNENMVMATFGPGILYSVSLHISLYMVSKQKDGVPSSPKVL